MIPDADNKIVVKYRMKKKLVPIDEIELIDLHPDFRLSEEVRRIPFMNYTDSVRIHMGSSMLKQSIPLPNAQRPLVDTGNDEELKNNVLNEKFTKDEGVVTEITEDEVMIELPNKEKVRVPRRTAIQSVNDVDVYTEPKVKVGQKVKKGDVITGAVGLENDTYKQGLNALVLYHAMFGLVNEDALVISESFAKRAHSYSLIDLSFDVKSTEAIKWIAPIGTKVKSRDSILTVYKAVRLDEINKQLQNKLGGIFGDGSDFSEYTIENNLTVPNNIDEAIVSDVLIQENKHRRPPRTVKKPDYSFTLTSQKVIDEYEENKNRKIIYDEFPEYVAADTLDPVSLEDKSYRVVYTVRIRLVKVTNAIVGSKITNRYGGKGVVSKVLPDNQMPVIVDEKGNKKIVEVVMNPYSTINRKIASVNMESLLGKIAHKLHDNVEDMKNDPKKREKILPMLEKYYPGRFTSMTIDEFLDKHEKSNLEDVYYFNVGSFTTKFTPELIDEWANELGVDSREKILMPTNTIADLDELKAELPEDEYEEAIKKMDNKFVEVDKPLTCGYTTLMSLYHIPTYSNKVTSSLFGVDVNEFKDSPICGRGKYRVTGQKVGEMELTALLARGSKDFIETARKDTVQEDNQIFLNNLLGLGLTISDEKGYNQGGSSLKNQLNQMKVKFRLKNQK